ncbi:MAG: DUF6350 family protein [Acidipropionibacterium jensenii]|nr:DUF6350 family protein [Acidipropionibacterium jensenii]
MESSASRRRHDNGPRWPWPVVCALACLVGLASVWVLLTGLIIPEWLALPKGSFGDLVRGSTGLWLLAHGVPLSALGLRVSLVPLSLTLLLVVVGMQTSRYSARVMSDARRRADRPVALRQAGQVAALHATVHLVAVVFAASAAGVSGPSSWLRVLVGGLVLGTGPGLAGALRGARVRAAGMVPGGIRNTWAGAMIGSAVVVAGGSAALAVNLIANGSRVVALHESLGAGVWGGIVLILLQLSWLPNLIGWWSAWTLGPGFTLGLGSSVSPFGVHLGIVPAIPALGALPAAGDPGAASWLWLAVPALAGAAGAVVALRDRRLTDPRQILARGAGSGVVAARGVALRGVLSAGGIGAGRLSAIGPQMPQVLGMALVLLGGGGLLAGAAVAVLRWREAWSGDSPSGPTDEDREAGEDTRHLVRSSRRATASRREAGGTDGGKSRDQGQEPTRDGR